MLIFLKIEIFRNYEKGAKRRRKRGVENRLVVRWSYGGGMEIFSFFAQIELADRGWRIVFFSEEQGCEF